MAKKVVKKNILPAAFNTMLGLSLAGSLLHGVKTKKKLDKAEWIKDDMITNAKQLKEASTDFRNPDRDSIITETNDDIQRDMHKLNPKKDVVEEANDEN